ncbi:MAG: cyanoglobin [Lunatimonas sp.]|uniref:globin domain-containing protein n=1 Tax=Lunatimonas sp. TaxID=2060141 RepID=UPI00263A4231|nr:cyanoglobin [Lunatimonas sp.]MCC5936310.1 cyanoglobin [Lunatimonas sp.]
MNGEITIFEALGKEKIKMLAANFYMEVEKVEQLRNLYPKDLKPAEERLFWFLLHVFGGPSPYLEKRGHPMLRKRHFQWPIDGNMRNIWLSCMFRAIDSVPMEQETKDALLAYFVNAANHLVNR